MIELFEDPRLDKPSNEPAPEKLVKFRQISQDALKYIDCRHCHCAILGYFCTFF